MTESTAERPRARRRELVTAAAVCSAVAVALLHAAWLHPASTLPGVYGDPEQTAWFLGWCRYALEHGANPWLTTKLLAPAQVNLAWSVPTVPAGALLWPVTRTLGPVVSTVALTTIGFAATGFSGFVVLRALCDRAGAALAGAVLLELSPYLAGQGLAHANLVLAAYPPLVLLLLVRLLRDRRPPLRIGVWAGIATGVQLMLSEEIVASTLVATVVLLCVLALRQRYRIRDAVRPLLVSGALAAVVAAVIAGPMLAVQFLGPGRITGPVQPSGYFVSDLANVVLPTQVQAIDAGEAVSRSFTGSIVEATAYLGVPMLVLVAVMLRRRDPVSVVAAIAGGVLLLLSLGPSLHVLGHDTGVPLPWRLLEHVPLLGDALPARLSLFAGIAAVVIVVRALDAAPARSRLMPALAALVGLSWLPLQPYPSHAAVTPAWFLGGTPGVATGPAIVVVPFAHDFQSSEAMLWQAQAGLSFALAGEGYVVHGGPDGAARTGPVLNAFTRRLVDVEAGRAGGSAGSDAGVYRAALAEMGASAVVVGPVAHRDAMIELLGGVLPCPPRDGGGVTVFPVTGC